MIMLKEIIKQAQEKGILSSVLLPIFLDIEKDNNISAWQTILGSKRDFEKAGIQLPVDIDKLVNSIEKLWNGDRSIRRMRRYNKNNILNVFDYFMFPEYDRTTESSFYLKNNLFIP